MIIILAAFLFSYYFINIAGVPHAIKKGFKMKAGSRLKPFDCMSCLSAWSAGVFYFMPDLVVQFVAIFFGAGVLGNIDFIQWIRDVLYKIQR